MDEALEQLRAARAALALAQAQAGQARYASSTSTPAGAAADYAYGEEADQKAWWQLAASNAELAASLMQRVAGAAATVSTLQRRLLACKGITPHEQLMFAQDVATILDALVPPPPAA